MSKQKTIKTITEQDKLSVTVSTLLNYLHSQFDCLCRYDYAGKRYLVTILQGKIFTVDESKIHEFVDNMLTEIITLVYPQDNKTIKRWIDKYGDRIDEKNYLAAVETTRITGNLIFDDEQLLAQIQAIN